MRREERRKKDNIEKLEQELEQKKKLPQEVKEKINAKIFENVVILVLIMVYLVSLNLGMNNIPTDNYIMDLKVFSIMLLIVSIMLFEFGYKKDNESLWLHGVEVMIVRSIYIISNTFIFCMVFELWSSNTNCRGSICNILCDKNFNS